MARPVPVWRSFLANPAEVPPGVVAYIARQRAGFLFHC
jgi:hypothetical protein